MAATTGKRICSRRLKAAWPSRESRSASCAVVTAASILMSAPAMKLSGLPLMSTAALTRASLDSSETRASNSREVLSCSVFTASPGTS
jgi:hypothetical protein